MKFKGKLWKIHKSYAVTIPSDFVKHGMIDADKEYEFEIKEVEA